MRRLIGKLKRKSRGSHIYQRMIIGKNLQRSYLESKGNLFGVMKRIASRNRDVVGSGDVKD